MPRSGWALIGVLLLAGGCGAAEVDRTQLEVQVKRSIEQQAGASSRMTAVSCPDRLKAQAGAQTRCSVTTEKGQQVDAVVTVTGTANNRLQFTLKLDRNPAP
ncbi:MAG: DUF4333 domain-containing protein [Actinobacteria bacterium]|nr:DUF4333 domain-containing protein [Actinomycetota bacterium]MBI3686313.1 DUF4333 domain-containing protein [Actinomycetota bacterium]